MTLSFTDNGRHDHQVDIVWELIAFLFIFNKVIVNAWEVGWGEKRKC